MCGKVIINKGEKEIETPQEFKDHFGFEAPREEYYHTVDMDCCLCQVDIEKALTDHNIPFEKDCGDIYVTQEPVKEEIAQSVEKVIPEKICPRCLTDENVISEGLSGAQGSSGFNDDGVTSKYHSESNWYCTKCFTSFCVKITAIQHDKDIRIGMNGYTGTRG